MNIKKLNWKDNVTKLGKEIGIFELISKVQHLSLYYMITNRKYYGDEINTNNKFFMCETRSNTNIECDSVEECKIKAQEHFEKMVLETFFED